MKYDFTTILDRSNVGSMKWDTMKAQNPNAEKGAVPFSVADMEFPTAPEIVTAITDYVSHNNLGYTFPTDEYYAVLNTWMKKYYNFEVKKEEVLVYHGVVNALYQSVRTFCKKDEGVIIMTPVYLHFYDCVENNDCKVVKCPLINKNEDYTIDFEKFEICCKNPNNTLMILCSPHNPVGRVWTREELYKIAKICKENSVVLISDEIHGDIVMPNQQRISMASFEEFVDNTVICTAPSKTFNLASMQTSNIIVKNPILREKLQNTIRILSASSFSVLGFISGTAGYKYCENWMEEMLEVVYDNFLYVENFIKTKLPMLQIAPLQGTYLAWINCNALNIKPEELKNFFGEHNVFINDGEIFGEEGKGYIRIVLAAPKASIEKLMQSIETAVNQIK